MSSTSIPPSPSNRNNSENRATGSGATPNAKPAIQKMMHGHFGLILEKTAKKHMASSILADQHGSHTAPALRRADDSNGGGGGRFGQRDEGEKGVADPAGGAGLEDASGFDPLDPATRQAAQLAPPIGLQDLLNNNPSHASFNARMHEDEAVMPRARVSMEELLPQLVRRIAWAGDRSRGTVQLELGAGRHEGTIVTVHADAGRVRIELSGKDARDVDDLRGRIDKRLRRHGLDVESVT